MEIERSGEPVAERAGAARSRRTGAEEETAAAPTAGAATAAAAAAEFPGCRPERLPREDLDTCDMRFEFWDGDTQTAWVVRAPTTDTHELPSHRLAALAARIADARGAPIECFGSMDLSYRDERGERRWILQADQAVYLHPDRARLPQGAGMVVGEHDFPDVVLEVDHTTDVRRGKLALYEAWGFPEVWVDVPERRPASGRRPARRLPGLTVYRLDSGGEYRTVHESGAFPGWRVEEIHGAMEEPWVSLTTGRMLARVGRALGARVGTGPDDSPWLRMHRDAARAEGEARGRARVLEAAARKALAMRGFPEPFRLDPREWSDVSDEAVLDALYECEDEADFHARLRRAAARARAR